MIENYRTGFVWDLLKKSPYVVNGLRRAGFTGGWLDAAERPGVTVTATATTTPGAPAMSPRRPRVYPHTRAIVTARHLRRCRRLQLLQRRPGQGADEPAR